MRQLLGVVVVVLVAFAVAATTITWIIGAPTLVHNSYSEMHGYLGGLPVSIADAGAQVLSVTYLLLSIAGMVLLYSLAIRWLQRKS